MIKRTEAVLPSLVGRATIRDVARLAGVSIGTVSAVLNNPGAVAVATRRNVARCIAELRFEPNNAAQTLKRHRSASIGLIVPDLQNPFFADIAEGVQEGAAQRDILVVLCITSALAEREDYFAKVLRTQRLDGVVCLSGSGLPSAALLDLARSGQIVFVDERLPGIDAPFVAAQNRAGARAVAQHVLDFGHRRVAILGGPASLWTSEQRLAGYREAIVRAGLEPDSAGYVTGDYTEESGFAGAATLLSGKAARPTALLCGNDLMALGALKRCREMGIRVPQDLGIVGFDDIPSSQLVDPPLTTVAQPAREMGRCAARLLLHTIGVIPETPKQTEFPTQICVRSSVSPVA